MGTALSAARRILYVMPGVVVMVAILASSGPRMAAMRNDFLQFYASAQLLGTPGYYNEAANRELCERLAPEARLSGFPCRPPFQTMLLWPLLRPLPLRAAFLSFLVLSVLCLIAFTTLFAGGNAALPVYASLSMPVVICLINGQDTLLVLLAAGLGVWLAERERPVAAGLVLAVCAVKFHIFVFLPLLLLMQKRWRMLAGWGAGSAGLLAASFAVQGWRWPLELLAVLQKPGLNPFVELMPNLHGLWTRLGVGGLPAVAVTSLGAALLVVAALRGGELRRGMAAVVTGGLLVSYHSYLYDPALLLLPLALMPGRAVWPVVCLPPLYWLAVLDGPLGTAGCVALVVAMAAALVDLAFPGWLPGVTWRPARAATA